MPQIQDIIHKFEEGTGLRYLKYGLLCLVGATLMLSYNLRGFKNMTNPEAMDTAQLARNIAEDKGYTTLFVRPFSMALLKKNYEREHGRLPVGDRTDASQIKGMHPDLANAPLYPFILAGLMKIFPNIQSQPTASLTGGARQSFWNFGGGFWMYPPDFWISFFNQFLFIVTVAMVFVLARRLFDPKVAWTSAAIYLGTDIFWHFSISGLSTILSILIFLTMAWTLSHLEQKVREGNWGITRQILVTLIVGALTGLGCLTRYSTGWLIIPVVIFIALFLGKRKGIFAVAAVGAFALVIGFWVARNYRLSHTPFGTAGFCIYENTLFFPEFRLGRSLDPDFSRVGYDQLWSKFILNTRGILQDDLLHLGGGWVTAFFLTGLLIFFKNRTLNRLRGFVLLCLPFLIAAQALGRTQLSQDSQINSENLLVLVAPLVIIFGVSLFYILLDQMQLPIMQLRSLVVGLFCIVMCLPTINGLFLPRTTAIAYPPYYPPVIQQTAGWMKPDELMMSDIPWGVAWYGHRQCLWLTLNAQQDFFEVYDYKPINAVYLTPLTLDSRILSQWVRAAEYSWGSFALDCMLRKELPPNFPLKNAPDNFLPEQLFLTDSERWLRPPTPLVK